MLSPALPTGGDTRLLYLKHTPQMPLWQIRDGNATPDHCACYVIPFVPDLTLVVRALYASSTFRIETQVDMLVSTQTPGANGLAM